MSENESNLKIKISESDFMKIWNAAEIKTMDDNNLLQEYDLVYLQSEAKTAETFYKTFCADIDPGHCISCGEKCDYCTESLNNKKQSGGFVSKVELNLDIGNYDCEFIPKVNLFREIALGLEKNVRQFNKADLEYCKDYNIRNCDLKEVNANLELCIRHLEDARMRLGKAIQHFDGGISIYDEGGK